MARIAKIEVKRCIIAYMKDLILQSRLLFSADSQLLISTTSELRDPKTWGFSTVSPRVESLMLESSNRKYGRG